MFFSFFRWDILAALGTEVCGDWSLREMLHIEMSWMPFNSSIVRGCRVRMFRHTFLRELLAGRVSEPEIMVKRRLISGRIRRWKPNRSLDIGMLVESPSTSFCQESLDATTFRIKLSPFLVSGEVGRWDISTSRGSKRSSLLSFEQEGPDALISSRPILEASTLRLRLAHGQALPSATI